MDKNLVLFNDEELGYKKGELFEGKYTNKVNTPIYTPKRKNVCIYELYDDTRYERLCRFIDKSVADEKEKKFLKLAASRFIIFNYECIADYYSCANKGVQEIFEKLALVIIDFDKAIENGFIQLNEQMKSLYEQELDCTEHE